MSASACDRIRAAALDPGTAPEVWARLSDVAAHVRDCPSCRDWLDAFVAGDQAWAGLPADDFAAQVIARTAGVDEVERDLPLLADMDPGPGFAERVLMATSRQPASERWRARAVGAWWALVRRPRFAWEAAYLATVCWVLLFGNPVGAIEWSTSNIGAAARERLGPPVMELRADLETWRSRLAPETAAQGPAARQQTEAPPVVRAWQTAASWIRALTTPVVEVFRVAWETVAGWLEKTGGQPSGPSTEPPADAARSSQ